MKTKFKQRYLPHKIETRVNAVIFYRQGNSIKSVCRRYKISKSSLMRWNKRYNGKKTSLEDKSHRPYTKHPNSHTDEEIRWIKNYIRRNPNIGLSELYGKLRKKRNYSKDIASLYRVLVRMKYINPNKDKKKKYIPQKYDTPKLIGIKWQMDVKEIPKKCYIGKYEPKFYQYTVQDEASRERFIHPYEEHTPDSSEDCLKRAFRYFGYKPEILQTDNGSEFNYIRPTTKVHKVDKICNKYGIKHQRIKVRTPRHNGKVERSHGLDERRFYKNLQFYSLEDLTVQMKRYLRKVNNIPSRPLKWNSPKDMRKILLKPYKRYKVYVILYNLLLKRLGKY